MINRSNKILLLLAAFYYVVQVESSIHSYYPCDFAASPSDPITVTQMYEPDLLRCYQSIFIDYLGEKTYFKKDFTRQWQLSLFHFNCYIMHHFLQFSKNTINYQHISVNIHTKNILYIQDSDNIPLC